MAAHGLAAGRDQQGEEGEGRQHEVLKAEGAVLPFIVAIAAEGEVVGRVPGEGLAEAVVADLGIDFGWYVHRARPTSEVLPWDTINVKKGREYLEKEQNRSLLQLQVMATAE